MNSFRINNPEDGEASETSQQDLESYSVRFFTENGQVRSVRHIEVSFA